MSVSTLSEVEGILVFLQNTMFISLIVVESYKVTYSGTGMSEHVNFSTSWDETNMVFGKEQEYSIYYIRFKPIIDEISGNSSTPVTIKDNSLILSVG